MLTLLKILLVLFVGLLVLGALGVWIKVNELPPTKYPYEQEVFGRKYVVWSLEEHVRRGWSYLHAAVGVVLALVIWECL